jgi:hypothetical protein
MAKFIVQHRRGTASQWASNSDIVPKVGELVIEIDEENSLHKLKIGDGIHTYAELAYLQAGDEIVTQVLTKAKPRVTTITLTADWIEVAEGKYGQVIELGEITKYSRLDLQPDVDMIAEFKKLGLVFVTENNDGVITVYSVGNMPLNSYTMQATIVETECGELDAPVIGIPVGAPAPQVGKDIGNGVEIFNDYKNNETNIPYAHIEGKNNKAVIKAYNVIHDLTVGNQVCINLGYHYDEEEGKEVTDFNVGDVWNIFYRGDDGYVYKARGNIEACNMDLDNEQTILTLVGNPLPIDNNSVDEGTFLNKLIINGGSVGTDDILAKDMEDAGFSIHMEGSNNIGFLNSHVEGTKNKGLGYASDAGGYETIALGERAFTRGYRTKATGHESEAGGNACIASGYAAVAKGSGTKAIGAGSTSNGNATEAIGDYSDAHGNNSKAKGKASRASGTGSQANAEASDAGGISTVAGGNGSMSRGKGTNASAHYSFAAGEYTDAQGRAQTVRGIYNKKDKYNYRQINNTNYGQFADIVGNGTADDKRSNAYTLDWDGNGWFAGDVTVGVNNDKLATEKVVDEKIAAMVDSAPETLNTLNELAEALGDDSNFAVTMTNELAQKAEQSIVANALKARKSGKNVNLGDISPIPHTLNVKVKSKNLLVYPYTTTTTTRSGITFTDNGDGSITVNGTSTSSEHIYFNIARLSKLEVGSAYTLTGCPTGGGQDIAYLRIHEGSMYSDPHHYDYGSGVTFSPIFAYITVRLYIAPGATVENLTFYPQLEFGNRATEYTKYTNEVGNVEVEGDKHYFSLEDGTVENIISTNMTGLYLIGSEYDKFVLDVEYNRDINKAFAELEEKLINAIISLGGNV